MSIRTHTRTTIDLPNGEEAEVPSFIQSKEYLRTICVGKSFVIATREIDDDCQDQDPREYAGFGTFTEFRSQDAMEEAMDEATHAKKLYYLVDKYEHGSVHYSVRDTAAYPDRQWDVRTNGLFVVCDDVQQQYDRRVNDLLVTKTGKGAEQFTALAEAHAEARGEFVKDTNLQLQEFTNWANGDVWGVISLTFDADGTELDQDACWGMIGYDYAESEIKSRLIHSSGLDFKGDGHVGFIRCSEEDAGLIRPIEDLNATAYDEERGGVHVAIKAEKLEEAQALLVQYGDALSTTLHLYPERAPELADYVEPIKDFAAIADAQLAWCDWNKVNIANSDYDKGAIRHSLEFWSEKAEAIKTNVVELTKKAALAAAPAPEQSAPDLSM